MNGQYEEILFMSASFDRYQIALGTLGHWVIKVEKEGHIADSLFDVLHEILAACNFKNLTIFLLNGPGSTLGIRSLCAFVRTLIALEKITDSQVHVCDNLHFAYACLKQRMSTKIPLICGRVNLSQVLCLDASGCIRELRECENEETIWLPHPCLSNEKTFVFDLDEISPILKKHSPWYSSAKPDVFDYSKITA